MKADEASKKNSIYKSYKHSEIWSFKVWFNLFYLCDFW